MLKIYSGSITVAAAPQQITSVPGNIAAKIIVQMAPDATGNGKVGTTSGLTADNATPGIFIPPSAVVNPDGSASPGASWSMEVKTERNTIDLLQYWFHGTHVGDVIMWEVHRHR